MSQRGRGRSGRLVVAGIGLALVAAVLFFVVRGGGSTCSMVAATVIEGDRAVVACRPVYRDTLKADLSLWVISLQDGRALERIAIERDGNEWVNVIGRQGKWLWVSIGEQKLRAYGLPNASPVRVLDGALAQHEVLRHGMTNNRWVSDAGAVLQGKDSRDYVITPEGAVARFTGTRRELWSIRAVDDSSTGRLTVAVREDGERLRPDAEALVQPEILVERGEPIWLDEGRGALAASVDVIGPEGNERLSRIDLAGAPVWTVATERIMQAAGARPRGSCRFRGAHVEAGSLWTTILCIGYYRYADGPRQMAVASRIVALDPATGRTLRAIEPHIVD